MWPGRLRKREEGPELMDASDIDPSLHREALRGLERINGLSGVVRPIWTIIRRWAEKKNFVGPVRILDVATGAGDFPIRLALRARRSGVPLVIEGCDKSETALDHARRRAEARNLSLRFFQLDILKDSLPPSCDVFTCNLFLHHLSPGEILQLMKNFRSSGARLVVIQDLERSLPGIFAAYLGSRLLTRSAVVRFDAVQSVRNACRMEEARAFAEEAGWREIEIRRIWPFRFLLVGRP